MDTEVLIPFKKADFLLDVIKDLESYRDNDIRGYDDYSEDWYKGFKVGINNTIHIINKHIKRDVGVAQRAVQPTAMDGVASHTRASRDAEVVGSTPTPDKKKREGNDVKRD